MKRVNYEELKKLPDGTLFTYDSPDRFVRAAIFEKLPTTIVETSQFFQVYESADLRDLQQKIEFALGLMPHRTDYEP